MEKLQITNRKSQQGYTFIELVVTIFGFTLIIWGLVGLFSHIFSVSSQQGGLLSDSDQARKLAFQITSELRDGQSAQTGAYVLDTAGAQEIIFYSPNTDSDSGVERVRYYVQGGKLWKGVTQYNGSSYDTSTESTTVVQNNLANGASPVFYYYDGSYVGSSTQTSLAQPVSVTRVKFVNVTLQIYNKAGVNKTNTYTVTSSAAIRNLKVNLGS